MIHNVNGVIVIDGVPAPEIVAAAVRNGWVQFPMKWNTEVPIYRVVVEPLNTDTNAKPAGET